MKYRLTILNIIGLLFLFGIVVFSIFNYKQLTENEGWGMVGMIGLASIALIVIIVDFILQAFIKNKTTKNNITFVLLILLAVFVVLAMV